MASFESTLWPLCTDCALDCVEDWPLARVGVLAAGCEVCGEVAGWIQAVPFWSAPAAPVWEQALALVYLRQLDADVRATA